MNRGVNKRFRFLNYEFCIHLILTWCVFTFIQSKVEVLLCFRRLDACSAFDLFFTAPLYRDIMTPKLNFCAL
jgi:hypothetical protein